MRRAHTNRRSWLLLASLIGPIAWALHFAAVYATQTVLNIYSGSRAALVGATFGYALLAVAATVFVLGRLPRSGQMTYVKQLAVGLALLSLIAMAWTCLSVAALDVAP